MTLHSNGFKNPSKKLYRDEMSRLLEEEQLLLRQENERLQAEVCNTKGDLVQAREKVSHSLKQYGLVLGEWCQQQQRDGG